MKIYAEISKTEKQDDGTIKVWGYASSEAVDSDGETITAEAMRAALPDYMKFGAVREMHQPSAAGTAIEANVEDDGRTYFGAHVVDPIAVKKVETGVYKGFSIGGKVTARDEVNKSIIKGLKLVEVSLVDRPANPEAVFTCYKAETVDEEQPTAIDALAEMLDKGEVSAERLIELAKSEVEQVDKGLYGVARFASLLSDVKYLADDTQWEAEYEGDDSALPGKIKEWLATGLALLAEMVAEEGAEALKDKAAAQKSADDGALLKVSAELDLLKSAVSKLAGERDALEKRVKELEAKPALGKALLKAIEKGQDVGTTEIEKEDASQVDPKATPEEVALSQIRKMYRSASQRGG